MALWTMTPDGKRVRVVSDHRAHAAAMTEGKPLTGEQTERLTVALRQMDAMIWATPFTPTRVVRYPSAGRNP